jgi:hypothetical protein
MRQHNQRTVPNADPIEHQMITVSLPRFIIIPGGDTHRGVRGASGPPHQVPQSFMVVDTDILINIFFQNPQAEIVPACAWGTRVIDDPGRAYPCRDDMSFRVVTKTTIRT